MHSLLDGATSLELGLALAGPGELVALARAVDDYVRKVVAKGIEVDGERNIAVCIHSLGYDVRKERGNLSYVLLR